MEFVKGDSPRCYLEKRVDGLIVTKRPTAEQLKRLSGIAFVVCPNTPTGRAAVNCVVQGNEYGARQATEQLIGLGHKRIAFAAHNYHTMAFKERYYGYLQAIQEAGLEVRAFTENQPIADCSVDLSRRIMDAGCTALIAASDLAACYIIQDLAGFGLNVPEDISVIGWDRHAGEAWRGPRITTIDGNMAQIGREAIRLLARLHEYKEQQAPVHIQVTPTLVPGHTVATCRN